TLKQPFAAEVESFEREAMASVQVTPSVEGTSMAPAFTHIFSGGYAAGYYSYKWAEQLDADAFALFKEKGIFNREIAKSFLDNVLSRGGTEHPMKLYVRFRGQEPTIDAMLERNGIKR
ncbi:MAG: peptidase M3, partial [Paludibacteraceae bacterium]|nr:peptidase M3 [Paludibacteraceae bacterium]